MLKFAVNIANQVVDVAAIYDSTMACCHDFISSEIADFSVTITPDDIACEREISMREHEAEGTPYPNYSDAQLEITALQRKIAEEFFARNVLLFHGSAVAVDGEVYLFTAKSGTGKSTHTRLWREHFGQRAVMVNDDKPFLRIEKDGVMVCGSPWMGKHRLGNNIQLPLKAICVLERGEENSIRPITPREALPMLMQQSHRPANPAMLGKYLELIDGLAGAVKFYRLRCNMDPDAATVAYEGMK